MEKNKNVFQGFSDDDEVIVTGDNNTKTPEQIESERVAAAEVEKNKKTPEQIEADRVAAEEEEKNKKTPEQIEAERVAAAEAEKNKKTPEEIATEKAEKRKGMTPKQIAELDKEEAAAAESELSLVLKLDDTDDDDKGDNDKNEKVNFISTAKDLEIELGENEKELTKEMFIEKVKEKIEASKEVFNYQNIPADVLDVVKFFAEEGGTTADLLADNDVILAEVYLSMSPEAKFVRFQSEKLMKVGLTEDEAAERATEMWGQKSEKDQAQAVNEIDRQLVAFKNQAIKEIVTTRKEIVQKQKDQAQAQAKAEKSKMVDVVKGMTEFMGLELPSDVKDKLIRKIENGDIDKILSKSVAKARVNAFMLELFGTQINETNKKKLTDTSRESYNKGVQKFLEKNHNVKPERKETGQQTDKSAKKFDFSGIDEQ